MTQNPRARPTSVDCDHCGRSVPLYETRGILPDDETWCDQCVSDDGMSCYECGSVYDINADALIRAEDIHEWVCEDCFDTNDYFQCVDCGRSFSGEANEGGERCRACAEEAEESGSIQDYHQHTRRWNRFGRAADGVYYGVELESVARHRGVRFQDVAQQVLRKFGKIGRREFLFTEYDGSLRDEHGRYAGYETIFHPMSFGFASRRKALLKRILDFMSNSGMAGIGSWSLRQIVAGMHVTITLENMNNAERAKFLHLIYDNKALTTRVSRRLKPHLEEWASVRPPAKIESMVEHRSGWAAKRVAVNLKRVLDRRSMDRIDLAEVRIFSSTLEIDSFMMNIEFVAACVDFAKNRSFGVEDTLAENLLAYIDRRKRVYPHLYAWLEDEGLIK